MRIQADRARGGGSRSGERGGRGTRYGLETQQPAEMVRANRPISPEAFGEDPYARRYIEPPKRRGFFRDVLVVAGLAVAAVVLYPNVAPYLPPSWRANIASVIAPFAPPRSMAAQTQAAVVVRDVNLRAGPSTTTKVVALLPRGSRVATAERRGEWTFVQVEAYNTKTQLRSGWVYASFLEVVEDEAELPSEDID